MFPIAAVVPATPVHLDVNWPVLLTLVPLACLMSGALGLMFGTMFDPRTVPMLFGVIVIPITFLGCTYYPWQALEPIRWLQIAVLVNPLVYISEGFRAALTPGAAHEPVRGLRRARSASPCCSPTSASAASPSASSPEPRPSGTYIDTHPPFFFFFFFYAGPLRTSSGQTGHMTPLGVHHVSINVDDVDAARRFYVDILGLTERTDRPAFSFDGAWLNIGAQQVHLIEAPLPPELAQHFAIEVDDSMRSSPSCGPTGIEVTAPKRSAPAANRSSTIPAATGSSCRPADISRPIWSPTFSISRTWVTRSPFETQSDQMATVAAARLADDQLGLEHHVV